MQSLMGSLDRIYIVSILKKHVDRERVFLKLILIELSDGFWNKW